MGGVLVISLLLLGGFIAKNLYDQRQSSVSVAQDRLSVGAKALALHVERRLTSIDAALLDVRKNLPSLRAEIDGDKHVAMHLQTLQNTVDGIRTIGVFDTQGNTTASSRSELVGKNFSQREFFQAALQNPDLRMLHVSAPFKTSLGAYSLNLTRTTFDSMGEFSGIVTATLDPEDLKPTLASLRYTPDVSVGLIHGSGKVLLYLSIPEIACDISLSGAWLSDLELPSQSPAYRAF